MQQSSPGRPSSGCPGNTARRWAPTEHRATPDLLMAGAAHISCAIPLMACHLASASRHAASIPSVKHLEGLASLMSNASLAEPAPLPRSTPGWPPASAAGAPARNFHHARLPKGHITSRRSKFELSADVLRVGLYQGCQPLDGIDPGLAVPHVNQETALGDKWVM
jgi:hypothetical protein